MSRKTTFRAQYTSRWGDGTEIVADVWLDDKDGRIMSDIPCDGDDHGLLESETVLTHLGTRLHVCPKCHMYVVRNSKCESCGEI